MGTRVLINYKHPDPMPVGFEASGANVMETIYCNTCPDFVKLFVLEKSYEDGNDTLPRHDVETLKSLGWSYSVCPKCKEKKENVETIQPLRQL
jgi:hypothetical protein